MIHRESGTTFKTYKIVSDSLGSVRYVLDVTGTGTPTAAMSYDAFGVLDSSSTNSGFVSVGFAGGLSDPDTKLIRFGARDYDPEVGRWTARDPIGFEGGSGSLYVYVDSDPINSNDPSGLFFLPGCIAGGLAGGFMGGASALAGAAAGQAATGGCKIRWAPVVISAGAGALTGCFAGSGVSAAMGAAEAGGAAIAAAAAAGFGEQPLARIATSFGTGLAGAFTW